MYVPNFFVRTFSYLPPDLFLECIFFPQGENFSEPHYSQTQNVEVFADVKAGAKTFVESKA